MHELRTDVHLFQGFCDSNSLYYSVWTSFLEYFTGWCVTVEVATCFAVGYDYPLSLHLHVHLCQQRPPLCFPVCVSFPCGRRHVLHFRGIAANICTIVTMGISALIQINCARFQVPLYLRVSEVRPIQQGVIRWDVFTDEMYLLVQSRSEWE